MSSLGFVAADARKQSDAKGLIAGFRAEKNKPRQFIIVAVDLKTAADLAIRLGEVRFRRFNGPSSSAMERFAVGAADVLPGRI